MYSIVISYPSTVSMYHAYDHITAGKEPDEVSSTLYRYYLEVMLTTTRELDIFSHVLGKTKMTQVFTFLHFIVHTKKKCVYCATYFTCNMELIFRMSQKWGPY
jgi:hypothetical protein